jgi:hypothetical protein
LNVAAAAAAVVLLHFATIIRLDDPQQRGTVIREVKHSEGTMQELAAAGAPTSVSGYENVDDATAGKC